MINPSRPILITGGAGMLAQALQEELRAVQSPSEVLSPDRKSLDLTDERQLKQLFEQMRPQTVFNCAAFTKVDLAEKQPDAADACNGYAVGKLAALCRAYDAALVHFSTDYVFDGTVRRPLRPDDPVGPQSAYGRSKLLGEQLIQQNPPPRWLIIRTAWLYGPGGPNFVQTMVNVARAGKPLRVVDDQIGSPTYTLDLVGATVALMQRGAQGIWHLTNAGEVSWFDFARAIFAEWELNPHLKPISSADWKITRPDSAPRPTYSVLDVQPYAALTGTAMRPWQAGLHEFKNRAQKKADPGKVGFEWGW